MRHYYEADRGPFKSLSELPPEEAETLLSTLRGEGVVFASKRPLDYLKVRCELEARLRQRFIVLGGKPERLHPHSLVLGECGWLRSWYRCAKELRLPLRELIQFHTDDKASVLCRQWHAERVERQRSCCKDGGSPLGGA